MKRNLGLLAIGITLWTGAFVQAQGPMPSPYPPIPNGYGYPGYPMPIQYQPMRMPGNPYANSQPMLPPPTQGAGPNQPYFATDMAPGKSLPPISKTVQAKPTPTPEAAPSLPPGEPVTIYQGPSTGLPIETEPVAIYEGNRYFAEMKLDNTHAWVRADYIHWWVSRPTAPALVMNGNSTLLGGEIAPKEFSGVLGQIGLWLDPEHRNALEITGQWLGKSSLQYAFASNAAGSPALSIPLLVPNANGSVPIATPGVLAGNINVDNIMSFHGAEVNVSQNVLRLNGCTFDYFGGFRYLYMNDNLTINQSRTALTPTALRVGGAAAPVGSTVLVSDSFNATNRFYGGDLGARLHWTHCRFDVGLAAKVALGVTSYVTVIDGASTLTTPTGARSTFTGGTFAQKSNIGRVTDTQFSTIPEVEATMSYQLTSHIRVLGGYTFMYWNRVQRSSDQLDRSVNLAQSPTSATFNPAATGNPLFPSARSELLIQGVNIGLELKY